ncbi:MAG: hypothetical protein IJN29_13860 [Akkermansia sp.]|nr:hypothetical protein [Akkermansia sp.]
MKQIALLLGALALTSCLGRGMLAANIARAQGIAPVSVAGRIIEMDGNGAESCSAPQGTQQWTEWIVEEHPCVFAYSFDDTNRYRVNFNPTDKAYLSYEKSGPDSAVIRNTGAPNHGTYTLHFETPTEGTATNNGSANGRDYMTRKIKFSIK